MENPDDYLRKARESLAGAASEFGNRRLNNCATGHLRDVLERLSARREVADYRPQQITETEARRGLNAAREFVHAIEQGGENR